MRRRGIGGLAACIVAVLMSAVVAHGDTAGAPKVVVIHVAGSLDGRIADLVTGGIRGAANAGADAVVLDLNSRGGTPADVSTIITALRRSPVPTLVWVAAGHRADGQARPVLNAADLAASASTIPGAVTASSLSAALVAVNGRPVARNANNWRLHTAGASLGEVNLDSGGAFRQGLADPDVSFLLLVLAIACLGLWAVHPGNLIPLIGTALAGLGAVLGLADLPVQWFGALLIGLALGLFLLDLVVTSHGLVTGVGVLLLLVGGGSLVDRGTYAGGVSVWLLLGCVALVIGSYALILPRLSHARRLPVLEPMQEMIGRVATVSDPVGQDGMVRLVGAYWRVHTGGRDLGAGESVRVISSQGLRLMVEPVSPDEAERIRTDRTPQTPQRIA